VLTGLLALRRDFLELRRQQRAGPEELVRRRQAIKQEISERLPASRSGYAPRAIIRDLARIDAYPEIDDRPWGISPWFRVETKGLYHRGLEVFLSIEELAIKDGVARHPKDGPHGELAKLYVVGRIPFDAIVSIDWDGDEHYAIPHIYCWFDQADGPYEAITLYESGYRDHLFLRDDLRYKPRRRSRLRAWRDHRSLRKAQRAFEREAARV
jgi:hypothetical protein